MSLIGGIVGGMIGFTLLGPIGALVGSVMGSRMTRQAKFRRNPNNLDHQVAFFTALFACLAKIAKADGRVSEEEVSKIESFISNKFNFTEDERNLGVCLIDIGGGTTDIAVGSELIRLFVFIKLPKPNIKCLH